MSHDPESGIDRRTFSSAVLRAGALVAAAPLLPAVPGSHPHAALFVYTRPLLRDRHATIVQKALERRAAVHTSAWRSTREGERVLAVGPVAKHAFFWHDKERGKAIRRTWPFVAVLEYDGVDEPTAFIDWFRRAGDSQSDDGWLLDPGVGYADHINKEMVTHNDARWCYMAVPDTPTDTHVGDSQFAIRARVQWKSGARAHSGLWLRFDAPRGRDTDDWHCARTPLVDWRVTDGDKKRGATSVGPVADAERELAVWGSDTVFRFPPMPAGLQPGRGRP